MFHSQCCDLWRSKSDPALHYGRNDSNVPTCTHYPAAVMCADVTAGDELCFPECEEDLRVCCWCSCCLAIVRAAGGLLLAWQQNTGFPTEIADAVFFATALCFICCSDSSVIACCVTQNGV